MLYIIAKIFSNISFSFILFLNLALKTVYILLIIIFYFINRYIIIFIIRFVIIFLTIIFFESIFLLLYILLDQLIHILNYHILDTIIISIIINMLNFIHSNTVCFDTLNLTIYWLIHYRIIFKSFISNIL